MATIRGEASLKEQNKSGQMLVKDASPLRPNGTTPGSVGAIVQNYKSITSRRISSQDNRLKGHVWQRNYYERIIRNDREWQAISNYILTNPENWEKDPDR